MFKGTRKGAYQNGLPVGPSTLVDQLVFAGTAGLGGFDALLVVTLVNKYTSRPALQSWMYHGESGMPKQASNILYSIATTPLLLRLPTTSKLQNMLFCCI